MGGELFSKTTSLDGLARGLASPGLSGRGPGEVGDGDDEEAVAAVGNTGQGVVPGGKGSQETEETTGLDDRRVGLAVGVALEVTDTEQQEGDIEEEEQEEESHGGSQGAEQQDGGEDEPAHEEKTEGVLEHGGLATVGFDESFLDVETTGGQDNGEGDPETTIGGQSSGTKGVTDSHFPETSERPRTSKVLDWTN